MTAYTATQLRAIADGLDNKNHDAEETAELLGKAYTLQEAVKNLTPKKPEDDPSNGIMETKQVYAVYVNTDLTEGRGREYIKHYCELQSTAIRLASKADVQGSNGQVTPITLFKHEDNFGRWYGPVHIEKPGKDDHKMQERVDARNAVIQKAIDLGLTEDEIATMKR